MNQHNIRFVEPAHSSWRQWIKTLGLFVIMLACGALLGWRGAAAPVQLAVESGKLRLGDLWVGTLRRHRITILNPAEDDAEIEGFVASCRCTSVRPSRLVIPAGKARTVELTFDLASGYSAETADAPVPFSIHVRPVITSGGVGARGWTFRGRARPLFDGLAGSLLLDGTHLVRAQGRTMRDTVEIKTRVPVEKLVAATDFPHCDVEASGGGNQFSLAFEFHPSAPLGTHEFDVRVDARLADGSVIEGIRLGIIAPVTDEWAALPAALDCGLVRAKETVLATTVIYSLTGRAVTSIEPRESGPWKFAVAPAGTDRSHLVVLTLKAAEEPGFYEHLLNLEVNVADNGAHPTIVAVPVRYQVVGKILSTRP